MHKTYPDFCINCTKFDKIVNLNGYSGAGLAW